MLAIFLIKNNNQKEREKERDESTDIIEQCFTLLNSSINKIRYFTNRSI